MGNVAMKCATCRDFIPYLGISLIPPRMDNYTKGEIIEAEDKIDLKVDENAIHMKVAGGSKIRNLMGFAMKQMKDPSCKQITWNGSGTAVSKAITCAEIMKRKIKGLHQITNIRFKRIEEHWEPNNDSLERLKVNRDVPALTILLSKDPLDTTIPGYQPPGSFDAFWKKGPLSASASQKAQAERKSPRKAASSTPSSKSEAGTAGDSPAYGSLTKKRKKRPKGKEPSSAKADDQASTPPAKGGQAGKKTREQKDTGKQKQKGTMGSKGASEDKNVEIMDIDS